MCFDTSLNTGEGKTGGGGGVSEATRALPETEEVPAGSETSDGGLFVNLTLYLVYTIEQTLSNRRADIELARPANI